MMTLHWIWRIFSFICYFLMEIVRGTARDVRATFLHHSKLNPAIVEVPLRCRSDVEIALYVWSITIPPGTAVITIAAGDGDRPASLFVHSMHNGDLDSLMDELYELETRLLRATRKEFAQ